MKQILLYFLSSRIFFLLVSIAAIHFVPIYTGYLGNQLGESPYLVWIWSNFDGRHYINIATMGYRNFDFAFFPLYSVLLSIAGYMLPISHLYIAPTLSILFFIFSLYFLHSIILLDYSEKIAKTAIIFCAFFPLSFFYHSSYPDSLFFFLTLSSFYFARRQKWFYAALLCALTTATRLSGIALVLALAVEWYLQNKNKKPYIGLPYLVTGSLGLIGYMGYLWFYHNDPLLFQKAMIAWRQEEIVFPFQVIFRYIKIFILVNKFSVVYWIAVLEFISLFTYLGLSYYVTKTVRKSYGVFMFAIVILVTFTGTFAGTPRYMLHLFPGFIALALLTNNKPKLRRTIIFVFIVLGIALVSLFTRGYFVS